MKPDWKDAPPWAHWIAMDFDGVWYWFENKPVPGDYGGWDVSEGKVETVVFPWLQTLETRP